jgi:hypothetical protein
MSKTSRSIFDALRLTLRAQPRSAKFRIKTLPAMNRLMPSLETNQ